MTQQFLRSLASDQRLTPESVRILHASGARTPEAILSLLESFPSLTTRGYLNASTLSNAVVQRAGPALQLILQKSGPGAPRPAPRRAANQRGYGAVPPPKAPWHLDATVPWTPNVARSIDAALAAPAGAAPVKAGQTQTDVRGCSPWPVRDQGTRGTCVAFGTTALRELLLCEVGGQIVDLSEQFLYWAIKTKSSDPQPSVDGTWIEFAFQALPAQGICPEVDWPYDAAPTPGNVSQGAPGVPSPAAITNAMSLRKTAALHEKITRPGGHAQTVLDALQKNKRPVAIALPVFSDPAVPQSDNWATSVGHFFGLVLDPPAHSTVIGGHCVCVTGFASDPSEPLGGYFVIRNSWSQQWGSQLPSPGYVGPEPGYGQVSASYVDQFLWEFGQL